MYSSIRGPIANAARARNFEKFNSMRGPVANAARVCRKKICESRKFNSMCGGPVANATRVSRKKIVNLESSIQCADPLRMLWPFSKI